ncbi:MAG: cysteine--tRNA ligase [bacterium]|nr:cysteine--tRNA ligase [bacterium]
MISVFRKSKKPSEIFFYNTLGKAKEIFKPLRGRVVKMYTCGPTVYDYAHIGNFRSYVFAETARRVLEYAGYEVKQVMNITDIGHLVGDGDEGVDKMTAGLKREGMDLTLENMKVLAERYAGEFIEDLKRLNVKLPFLFPRASEHVPDQIAFVKTLWEKGYAYKTSDGVYFDVGKFQKYGVLGGSASEEHSRVGVNPEKHDPRDFALWKLSAKGGSASGGDLLGWESPWGKGFPGWHIECAAMSTKYLGKTFDIHTGGIDLAPIHHNNEIAEAEAVTGKPLARYWMHGAFLTIEGKRIGKSEGNAIRLYQLEERGVSALAYRYLLLTVHYRQPMNFTWSAAEAAQTALKRAQRFFTDLKGSGKINQEYRVKFEAAIHDDVNMPEALAVMWDLIKDEAVPAGDKRETLLDFDRVFGIGFMPLLYRSAASERISVISLSDLSPEVEALISEREIARKNGQWHRADELRESLRALGFSVEDTTEGPIVRKA